MPDIEKVLHGRKLYRSFYWKQFRKKKQKLGKNWKNQEQAGLKPSDEECAFFLIKKVEKHLSKS